MKNLLLLTVWTALITCSLFAQSGFKEISVPSGAASVELGGRLVRIPAPENFTDTMVLYPHIAARLIAAESPTNDVLAVHVTNEILSRINNGEEPDLPFYTKVSVSKQLKAADIEALEFQTLTAEFEKQSPGALQSIVKTGEKGAGEALSKHWGTDARLKIGETKMLGYFNKQPQAISSMFLMNLEIFDRKLLVLGSMSLVHVNKRILFLYVFRTADSDQAVVADFTKSWTAKTVAANQ